eukprot:NODE_909_length_1315_cov_321.580952.p1 GENE.NODE_909_length_1315_cov_321.580952~~NODE_909_length_1315_cov_321.580952.p1  ORF type:complete len:381 (-),score=109.23 NODE_909_length_1315_cov_321.580952:155-1297(-)
MGFMAFRVKCSCLLDSWFRFDSMLAALIAIETWVLPVAFPQKSTPTAPLRILRLLRLARLMRLMRSLPELMTMIKGLKLACRAVASSVFMLLILDYAFSIVEHALLRDVSFVQDYFATLPLCMWTLLVNGTFLDNPGELLMSLRDSDERQVECRIGVAVFLLYVLISAMTIMNMLIGVLCEVVSSVANIEKEEGCVRVLQDLILGELMKHDADGNGAVNKEELESVLTEKTSMSIFEALEVNLNHLHALSEMLFAESAELPIRSVMETMIMNRGDMPASFRHIAEGNSITRWTLKAALKSSEAALEARLQSIEEQVARGMKEMVAAAEAAALAAGAASTTARCLLKPLLNAGNGSPVAEASCKDPSRAYEHCVTKTVHCI